MNEYTVTPVKKKEQLYINNYNKLIPEFDFLSQIATFIVRTEC